MENEIWKTRRVGWFGSRPMGRGALLEWMADINRRVERIEAALSEKPKTNRQKTLTKTP